MKGFIIVSPWAWMLINILGLLIVFISFPDQTYFTPIDTAFWLFIAINGFLLAYILMTYLFRDSSKKFLSASMSASLGPNDGMPVFIPPNEESRTPEMILMNLEGFNTKFYDVHSVGKCIAIFPSYLYNVFPGGGIEANCYLRRIPVRRLPKHIQEYLSGRLEGERGKNKRVWYGTKAYYDLSDRSRRLNVNYVLRFALLKARRTELKDINADMSTRIDALNKSTMKIKMYDKMGTPNSPMPVDTQNIIAPMSPRTNGGGGGQYEEPQYQPRQQGTRYVDPNVDAKGRPWKYR